MFLQILKENDIIYGGNMFINKIKSKELKKPIEVKIDKYYMIKNDDLNIYGHGDTKKEAIEDFKIALLDMYEDLLIHEKYTDKGKEYKKNFLAYFN